MPAYDFDRYLRYDELVAWLHDLASEHPHLVALETYGRSHEGRDLWLVTVTDGSSGAHDTKPAHWVDASIHSVELTATVAACYLLHHLVDGHRRSDPTVTDALRTRTFYVVPRVNPDGAEWALADSPRFRRSSVRRWPWRDDHVEPGLVAEDVDGDGRLLQMRVADDNGGWMAHPDDSRLMIPVAFDGAPAGTPRFRVLTEGRVHQYDGFTIPTPRPPEGLDLNRNYPAGWSTKVPGAGDHPLSEPEIDALVRAVAARPNICGFNAYHTSGGVLLRPSSTRPDAELPPFDLWAWKQIAERGTALTGYTSHSVYEDFTWDRAEVMSGASDDWAYEHLGVLSWTTEFWDVVKEATGHKQSTHFWYTGPTPEEALAVLRWLDQNAPEGHVDWYPFEHPELGAVEIGGWNDLMVWTNPPVGRLRAEVEPHASFAVAQALAAPALAVDHIGVDRLGPDTWRVEVGVANTGWLPTNVTVHAAKQSLVRPGRAEIAGAEVLDGPATRHFGQLDGRSALRFNDGNDGTPDRALVRWALRGTADTVVTVILKHDRAGQVSVDLELT